MKRTNLRLRSLGGCRGDALVSGRGRNPRGLTTAPASCSIARDSPGRRQERAPGTLRSPLMRAGEFTEWDVEIEMDRPAKTVCHVFPASGYPPALERYCRTFSHGSRPAPARGSNGMRESVSGHFNPPHAIARAKP